MKKGEKMSDERKEQLSKAINGHPVSEEARRKISEKLKGRPLSEETKRKMRMRKDERTGGWKGDAVGYSGIHKWVVRKLGSPRRCEHCGRTDKRKYEWANKTHVYRRVLEDFIRLCQECHVKYDKALNNKYEKGNTPSPR